MRRGSHFYALITCLVALATLLAGCVMEIGIESGATIEPHYEATIVALQTENARLATQIAERIEPEDASGLGKVAYVRGGDIWTKELPDGDPSRLTTDGRNSNPRWSPSGQWLVFEKSGNLWMMYADGSAAFAIEPSKSTRAWAWAPQSDELAYILNGDTIKVLNPSSNARLAFAPHLGPNGYPGVIQSLNWSPDGSTIAYYWQSGPEGQAPDYRGIWRLAPLTGEKSEVYSSETPGMVEVKLWGWSSDDQYLIFWQEALQAGRRMAKGAGLYSVPVAGGDPLPLVNAVLPHRDFVAADPTGSSLLAVIAGGGENTWTGKALVLVSASGGEPVTITPPDQAVSSPAWSSSGNLLAFVAMPDGGDIAGQEQTLSALTERRVWVTGTFPGAAGYKVAGHPSYRDEYPLWSLTGDYILFARLDAEGNASLWLAPATGADSLRVVDELTPAPEIIGAAGYIDWGQLFDWWRGLPTNQPRGR